MKKEVRVGMTKCPKCGEELKEAENIQYCINQKCNGWYCFRCEKWHPFGGSCANADIDGYNISDQISYDIWCKEHREDIFRMLKDSGYYNHCHDVYKYYPNDEESTGDYFKKELEELEDEL